MNLTMTGRVQKCDQSYIYIKIVDGYEDIFNIHKISDQLFDIYFEINQTTYQLQIQALDYLKEHSLFEVIINNPLYDLSLNLGLNDVIDSNDYSVHNYKLR